jgi:hypothetical protein
MVLFYNFLFVLIRQKVGRGTKRKKKKSRKKETSTHKASPGPAIFPGRRAWLADSSAVFLVFYGFANCFLLMSPGFCC